MPDLIIIATTTAPLSNPEPVLACRQCVQECLQCTCRGCCGRLGGACIAACSQFGQCSRSGGGGLRRSKGGSCRGRILLPCQPGHLRSGGGADHMQNSIVHLVRITTTEQMDAAAIATADTHVKLTSSTPLACAGRKISGSAEVASSCCCRCCRLSRTAVDTLGGLKVLPAWACSTHQYRPEGAVGRSQGLADRTACLIKHDGSRGRQQAATCVYTKSYRRRPAVGRLVIYTRCR